MASRKLDNAKTLAAEVGRNDKTRVTVAVQHAKELAPPRSMVRPSLSTLIEQAGLQVAIN